MSPEASKPCAQSVYNPTGGGDIDLTNEKQYPFEFAKTRMQLRDSPSPILSTGTTGAAKISRNPIVLIRDIVRTEGLSALYTGCTTLVVGTAFKASVRFLTFDSIKNALADEKGHLSKTSGILAGMMAGCVESVVAVTPTERIKTALYYLSLSIYRSPWQTGTNE